MLQTLDALIAEGRAGSDAEIAETFPVYDIRTVTLMPQREALRVVAKLRDKWLSPQGQQKPERK